MAIREILLLGDERLYAKSATVEKNGLQKAAAIGADLADTLADFRRSHGFGRAIAAPQISEPYRIIYMNSGGHEITFINPTIIFPDEETYELWDDCMSFPGLYVRVTRYKNCHVCYKDLDFNYQECEFTGDLAELFQHEYDHLDGILATQRAVDDRSFKMEFKA